MNAKDTIFYKIIRPIVKCLFYVLFLPKVEGTNNIPKKGALVLAGNHTKWLDPIMLIGTNKRQLHFMAKKELFDSKISFIMKAVGAISVNRKVHDGSSLVNAIEYLKNDKVIAIFPEGTINRTNDIIMPFKKGAVKMANETNATIVPFVITGKYKLFRRNIHIKYLSPIKLTNDIEKDNKKLEEIISSELAKEKKHGNN